MGGGRFSEILTCGVKIGRERAMSLRDAPCAADGRVMRRSRMGRRSWGFSARERLSSELENGFEGGIGEGGSMDDGVGRVKIVRTAASRESNVDKSAEPRFGGRVT